MTPQEAARLTTRAADGDRGDSTQVLRSLRDNSTPTGDAEEILRLRHNLLTVRDHIIGLEAENARLRALVKSRERRIRNLVEKLDDSRTRLKRLRQRHDDTERELADLRSSRAWRVGSLLTRFGR